MILLISKSQDFFKDYSSGELERVYKDIPESSEDEDLDVLVLQALLREKERLKKPVSKQKVSKSGETPERSLLSLLKVKDSPSYQDCLDLDKIGEVHEF